jgi:hypothetical protein
VLVEAGADAIVAAATLEEREGMLAELGLGEGDAMTEALAEDDEEGLGWTKDEGTATLVVALVGMTWA